MHYIYIKWFAKQTRGHAHLRVKQGGVRVRVGVEVEVEVGNMEVVQI
jgi:hypothetical protein